MSLSANFNEFYTSLSDIAMVNNNLDGKRDELKAIIHGFNHDIQAKSMDQELLTKHEQLGKLLENTLIQLKSTSHHWVENFEDLLHQEKFRSDLENYFIIIVFGKVKAGKSSLGNFIARNNSTDEKVNFFKYDEAGNEQGIKKLEEIEDENEFATNNLECTVEIQGFKLNGLAWVDTPGLGSMVEENGALAKKYIQSADYIIYPTSSNSPLQQDEIAQLKELFDQKKKVSICITKSDTQDRKKDEKGKFRRDEHGKIAKFLVNKSLSDRQSQEAYVKSEIEKICADQGDNIGDIFSISTHAASEALQTKDENLLQDSHMPKFYALITDVIKQKASSLKASTPYNGLLSFIDNGLLASSDKDGSIHALKSSLSYFDDKVEEAKQQFEIIKSNTNSEIKAEVDFEVSAHASKIDKSNSTQMFALIDEALKKSIATIINKNIHEVLQGFSSSLNALDSMLGSASAFSIHDEYKDIEVWYEDRSIVNYVTFGALGRSQSCIEERVCVGDNRDQVILQYKQDRTKVYVQTAINNYEQVTNTFFHPLANISNSIREDMKQLEQAMVLYKTNLREVSHG